MHKVWTKDVPPSERLSEVTIYTKELLLPFHFHDSQVGRLRKNFQLRYQKWERNIFSEMIRLKQPQDQEWSQDLAEVVCQFTANSPAANSTGWSCLPIRFKREIITLFLRISKRTVTFALNKVFQTRWRIFVAWHRNSGVFDLHFYLVWYKVYYGTTFNAAHYLQLL